MATKIRETFDAKAQAMNDAKEQKAATETEAIDFASIKLKRTYTPLREKRRKELVYIGLEQGLRPDLQKKVKLRKLSSKVLLAINRAALVDKASGAEISAKFKVNRRLVYRILKDFRTKRGYYEALKAKE